MGLSDGVHVFEDVLRLAQLRVITAAPSITAPVVWAVLAVLTAAYVLTHLRRAIGSTPIPYSVPLLKGGFVPLLGHCIPVLSNQHRLHDWLLERCQLMGEGKTFAFSLPLLPSSLMVTDPVCVEHVVKRNAENYPKGPRFYTNLGPILGHGIFTSDGEQWYWQRKLATQMFSVKSFKLYIDNVFEEKLVLLTDCISRAAAAGSPLDLHDLMYRFTLDSFGQLGFGVDVGCLRTQGKVPFAVAFDTAQVITNKRYWLPAWPLLEWLDGSGRELSRDCATIKAFALDIINKRRTQMAAAAAADKAAAAAAGTAAVADAGVGRDQGLSQMAAGSRSDVSGSIGGSNGGGSNGGSSGDRGHARDLLSLFMEAQGPDGKPLSTQQLVDTVINFIIAGRDTTAQALSWTFYLLMQHPQVEQKLLQEVADVLGPQQPAAAAADADAAAGDAAAAAEAGAAAAGSVVHPSYEQLRQLRYARAVFLEALRLYPSVPENCKYAVARDVLPDGTEVAPGTQVIYSPYVTNRLTRVWGPDAAAFRPERWLEMETAPSPYNYLTFNAGPRLCLGQRLAELEGVFVLTGLLARFSFRQAVPGTRVTYTCATTMPMKDGLMVLAQHRA